MSINTGKVVIPKEIIGDGGNGRCVVRTIEMTQTGYW